MKNNSLFILTIIFLFVILEGGNNWLGLPMLLFSNIILLIKVKKVSLPNTRIIKTYLFWLVIATITLLYSWDKESTIVALIWEWAIFISFLILYQFKASPKKIQKILTSFSIFSILISLVWTVFPKLLPKIIAFENPLTFIMGQNHLADLLIYPTLFLIISSSHFWLSSLFLFAILLSMSRSVWLSLAITIITFTKKKILKTVGIALLILSISFSFATAKFPQISKLTLKDPFGSRQYYWKQAASGIIYHPFGIGLGNFGYISQKYTSSPSVVSVYSHNFFLEKFAETGVIGGTTFLFLIIIILLSSRKSQYFPLLFAAAINAGLGFSWNFPAYRLLFLYFAAQSIPRKTKKQKTTLIYKSSFYNGLVLILLIFWTAISYWLILQPKSADQKRPIEEKIRLSPKNPGLYLQIPKSDQQLRRNLFQQYFELTQDFDFSQTNSYFRRKASNLFLEAAELEIENQNYQKAFQYTEAIFRSWPWERDWFTEIGQILPNDLGVKRQYAEVFMDKNYQNLNNDRIFIGKLFFELWRKTKEKEYLLRLTKIDPFAAEYYHEILNHYPNDSDEFKKTLSKCLEIFPSEPYCNELKQKI